MGLHYAKLHSNELLAIDRQHCNHLDSGGSTIDNKNIKRCCRSDPIIALSTDQVLV